MSVALSVALSFSSPSLILQVLKKMAAEVNVAVSTCTLTAPSLSPEQVRLSCDAQAPSSMAACSLNRGLDTGGVLQVGVLAGLVLMTIATYLYITSASRKVLLLDLYCFERPKE